MGIITIKSHIKKIQLLLALALAIASVVYAADSLTESHQGPNFYPTYPALKLNESAYPDLVKRGEYIAKSADCIACHTNSKEGGKPFAGGLPIKTPFGIFYSPNITPDKETGIGTWSVDNFVHAMHEGIRPDGKSYFPVFPYTSFTKVSKQDLIALKAYLEAIPAVHQENKKPTAPWPFSWRFGQIFWKWMFFNKGYYQYDTNKSAQWNRGAYLTQGLGHCGECHTPRNILGAMKNKYYLGGAFIDGYWSPNITGLEFRDTPISEINDVFDKDQLINKAGPVAGPMKEVDHNSMVYLTDSDRDAIALYLKSVQSIETRNANGSKPKPNKSSLKNGEKVYLQACAKCHENGAVGAPLMYDTANWYGRMQQGLPVLYDHVIKGYNQMPAKGSCLTCSDKDLQDSVDYILNESMSGIDVRMVKGTAVAPPDTSIEKGQKVYEQHCAICHKDGHMNAQKLGDKDLVSKPIDILIINSLHGVGNMPAKGGCKQCSNADIIAAVKYMAQQANPKGNYSLW
jgi:cytochrome c5